MLNRILFRTTPIVVLGSVFTIYFHLDAPNQYDMLWYIITWSLCCAVFQYIQINNILEKASPTLKILCAAAIFSSSAFLAKYFFDLTTWEAYKFTFLYTFYILAGTFLVVGLTKLFAKKS